jgi:uncharacterized membrane protein
MSPLKAYFITVLGNLLPIVPILFFLDRFSHGLGKYPRANRVYQKILEKSRAKGTQVEKYGLLGLTLFVAIPLPGTGAWTGSILAWLFGFRRIPSILFISMGVILAGIIVAAASIGLVKIALVYDLEYLLIIFLLVLFLFVGIKNRK